MLEILCLFFPSTISLVVFEKLQKKQLSRRNAILFYAICVTLVNTIAFSFGAFIMGGKMKQVNFGTGAYEGFIAKYLVCAVAVALVLSVVIYILCDNIKIKIETKKGEKLK